MKIGTTQFFHSKNVFVKLKHTLLFHNILSDCHYSDVINSLLNAFRLKKNSFISFLDISKKTRQSLAEIV